MSIGHYIVMSVTSKKKKNGSVTVFTFGEAVGSNGQVQLLTVTIRSQQIKQQMVPKSVDSFLDVRTVKKRNWKVDAQLTRLSLEPKVGRKEK